MAEKKGILAEFKEFVLRGNVVDLAVAVVIGAAFGDVVKALVADIITPLIGIPGKVDLSNRIFTINGSTFKYGLLINAIVTFLSVAAAVFLFVVKPVNMLTERRNKQVKTPEPVVNTRPCPECLSEIPKAARRCSFCTAEVGVYLEPEAAPTEPTA